MMNPTGLIDRCCRVWREPDAERLRALLEPVWPPGATYTDPTVHVDLSADGARIERIVGFFGPLPDSTPP